MKLDSALLNDRELIRAEFVRLDSPGRIAVLIATSYNLTIEFRGLREVPDAMVRALANGLNELQHKFLSQALSDLSGRIGYPNDVLLDIIFEVAENNGILDSAIAWLADAIFKFGKNGAGSD